MTFIEATDKFIETHKRMTEIEKKVSGQLDPKNPVSIKDFMFATVTVPAIIRDCQIVIEFNTDRFLAGCPMTAEEEKAATTFNEYAKEQKMFNGKHE